MSALLDYDTGPLNWIRGDLEALLQAALGRVQAFSVDADLTNALRLARDDLHQVAGALRMVGLEGAATVATAVEDGLSQIDAGQQPTGSANLGAVRHAIQGLARWIREVADGRGSSELVLFPLYRQLRELQGAEHVFESELFFPDLRTRAAPQPAGDSVELDVREARAARARFQRGLLAVLRGRDTGDGLKAMRDALTTIERMAPTQHARTFWWSCVGLMDCLLARGIDADFHVKQLLARVDLQMRRMVEGAPQVAERLLRDVLYFVARSRVAADRGAEVRETFALERYLPDGAFADPQTAARLRPVLGTMRSKIDAARDAWNRYAERGEAAALGQFTAALRQAQPQADMLQAPALQALLRQLAESGQAQAALGQPGKEALNVEVAATLLFLQNAVESEDILQADFAARAQGQAARLAALAEGRELPPAESLLDLPSRRVAERDMLQHIGAEVVANLRQIEAALDAFFRSPDDRAGLADLAPLAAQVRGALDMLELGDAAELLDAVVDAMRPFEAAGHPDEPLKVRLADALSSLGLFIEAHCAGQRDAAAILAPALAEFGLPTPKAPLVSDAGESVEAGLARRRAAVAEAYAAWRDGGAEAAREAFESTLIELGRDAELMADATLRQHVDAALAASRAGHADAALDGAVMRLTGAAFPGRKADQVAEAPPAAATARDTQPRYGAIIEYATPATQATPAAPADDAPDAVAAAESEAPPASEPAGFAMASVPDGVDAELLEIFIAEAQEVLARIDDALAAARRGDDVPGQLVVIRRGFHTLKGSGRMVGLDDFGEAAWALEHFMNGWLAQEKPASAGLLTVLGEARALFGEWVAALHDGTPCALNVAGLLADVERIAQGAGAASPAPLVATEPPAAAAQSPLVEAQPPSADAGSVAAADVPPVAEDVVVGRVRVSAGLFAVFRAEAGQRLGALREALAAPECVIDEAPRRAAHTLAGIAGTAGFHALADLAHALERYLNRRENRTLPAAHQPLLAETLARLDAMLAGIDARVEPHAAPDLIVALGEVEAADADAGAPVVVQDEAAAQTFGALIEYAAPVAAGPAATADVDREDAPVAAVTIAQMADLASQVAAPAPVAAPVFERRDVHDEIDAQLLPVFLDEAEQLMPQAAGELRAWKADAANRSARDALRRSLHTLKGSARMAGAMRLGELAHAMESRVVGVIEGSAAADGAFFDTLEGELDRAAAAVERLRHPVSDAPAPIEPPLEPVAPAVAAVAGEQPVAPLAGDGHDLTLRVRADWVDRMVNQAGEVAIARSRIESELFNFKRQVGELAESLGRLRAHVREVEIQAEAQMQSTFHAQGRDTAFDPLEFDRFTRFQEVTRFLAESVNDIATVQHVLLARLGEADAALVQQARLNRELQQDLLRVRMVPLYSVAERLYRTVRQTARDVGKRAQLDIRGGEIEIDRSVLEKVTAPIEHLLRNALAHGIEPPAVRRAAGKAEFGEITLVAAQSGNEIRLTLKDDGAGLDYARIRDKAVASGLLSAGLDPSPAQLAQFIFASGFSTAERVSEVAGRGVGMDVVKSEIAALGGRIDVSSQPGAGTEFNIYLPLTLAMTQAVIVDAGGETYALPTTLVQQVVELKPAALAEALAAGHVDWRGERFPLRYLPHLLGYTDAVHEVQRFNSVVLMRSGNSLAATLVDAIAGTREIVVKNIGPQLARVTGIAGATVHGDGRVMLILNPVPLMNRRVQAPAIPQPPAADGAEAGAAEQAPMVLVVDDSLTVRKITSRLLAREGYRVDTAKDGVDALERMRDLIPDVVLLDVEMPRMDGFELARVMKNDALLAAVPIIMITSRTADKHRNHALQIGVDLYLGKPYQERVLLDSIESLLRQTASV